MLPGLRYRRPAPRRQTLVSKRLDKSWTVFVSVENSEHDRCVDIFSRPDGSYGFEEFRRDIEDGGQWTPVQHYSGASYGSSAQALDTAERCVPLAGRCPRPETGTKTAYRPGLTTQNLTQPSKFRFACFYSLGGSSEAQLAACDRKTLARYQSDFPGGRSQALLAPAPRNAFARTWSSRSSRAGPEVRIRPVSIR